jgi:hypothetical protein
MGFNGITWNIYRIRFEQPINYDLVCSFDFEELDLKSDKWQEVLFMLSKEGLEKNSREDFFERVQSVNKYVIGNLLLSEPIVSVIRRELRKLAEGTKVDSEEIEEIIRTEVLKREIVDSDDAQAAQKKVSKFYKQKPTKKTSSRKPETPKPAPKENVPELSVTERLLAEADEESTE